VILPGQGEPGAGPEPRPPSTSCCAVVAVVALGAAIATAWVVVRHGHEVEFGNWDARVYFGMAANVSRELAISFGAAWKVVVASLKSTHNALFALPIAVGFRVFGESWRSYQLLVFLLYQLPASLLVGALAAALSTGRRLLVFCVTFGVVLTLPSMWRATILFYPDAAGLVPLVAMLLAYWRWRERLPVRALAGIAAGAAAAVLARRHFAFAVAAGFAAMAAVELAELARRAPHGQRVRTLAVRAAKLAGALAGAVLLLRLAAPGYLAQFFRNTSALYTAYRVPPAELAQDFASLVGAGTTLVALLGLAVAARSRRIPVAAAVYLGAYAVAWVGLWLAGAMYGGAQYVLHLFPLLQAVGIGLGAVALLEARRAWVRPLGLAIPVLLAARFLVAPWGGGDDAPAARIALGRALIPSRVHAPDADAYRRLVDLLRGVAAGGKEIYVAASSILMSEEILKSVDEESSPPGPRRLHFLKPAHVDTRDPIPVAGLLGADVVLVASPTQYHLAPGYQHLVDGVARLLSTGRPYRQAFERHPETVSFSVRPYEVSLWVRKRPTTIAEALDAVSFLQKELEVAPVGQGPWLLLSLTGKQMSGVNADGSSWLYFEQLPSAGQRVTDVVSLEEHSGRLAVTGHVKNSGCTSASARAGTVDPRGAVALGEPLDVSPGRTPDDGRFRFELSPAAPRRLILRVERPEGNAQSCAVYFPDLTVEPGPGR
jgi:hypothetical protein